jgi:hypothetical protein
MVETVDGSPSACQPGCVAHSCASRLAAKHHRGNLVLEPSGFLCGSSNFLQPTSKSVPRPCSVTQLIGSLVRSQAWAGGLIALCPNASREKGEQSLAFGAASPPRLERMEHMSAGKSPWWQLTRTARQGVGLGILWVGLGLGRLPDARDNILDLVASVFLLALGGFYLANAIALRRRERSGSRPGR